jgi:hypothetical protein
LRSVDAFAHGLDYGVDGVRGCRTGIAWRIDLGELGQVFRVVPVAPMNVQVASMRVIV